MENYKISISIIVKNEEALLARCLESVKEADEIIIVDTGSVDKTVEIGEKYTNKIFHFPWIDDFSAARNFAKEKCTGDFILSIDADEILEEGGIQKIRKLVSSQEVIGIKMKSTNQEYYVPRLFKNLSDTYFIGKIHEVLNKTNYEKSDIQITWGSSPAHKLDPDRNLRILEKCINENPLDSRSLFYLGREYGYKRDWMKTIDILERYVSISQFLPEKADAFFMLAVAYWNTNQGEKARERVLSSLNINANFKAPILLMAQMSFENNAKQWRKMAETATNEGVLFIRDNFNII